jgi:D-alanyl-D-alanine carboxypeptidase (penicillin-binding protein 5/6)
MVCFMAVPVMDEPAWARSVRRRRTVARPQPAPPPYKSAIVVDYSSGKVLFEDKADIRTTPASVTKLMTFLVIDEMIRRGEMSLSDTVTATREAALTGGSQIWLADREQVTVEELLYALMLQSANDAAVALAVHAAGSREAFVELMNQRAHELGMTNTVYQSPHGLPPRAGMQPDLTTARDLTILCRTLLDESSILKYSDTKEYEFRHQNGRVTKMVNHNRLLGVVNGCDGLKTGWCRAAGWCLAATVERDGRRIVAVILGCPEKTVRDKTSSQLIEKIFTTLPRFRPAETYRTSGGLSVKRVEHIEPALPDPSFDAPGSKTDDSASEIRLVPLEHERKIPSISNDPDVKTRRY